MVGYLLLICFTLPYAGTYLWLSYQKELVKQEVESQLTAGALQEEKELVLLKFTEPESQSELRWEHSREFEYKGQMYDVVETSVHNDTIYYWCWWDHEETKLNNQLKALVNDESEDDSKQREDKKHLTSLYESLYHLTAAQWCASLFAIKKQHEGFYTLQYSSMHYSPSLPPPKLG